MRSVCVPIVRCCGRHAPDSNTLTTMLLWWRIYRVSKTLLEILKIYWKFVNQISFGNAATASVY